MKYRFLFLHNSISLMKTMALGLLPKKTTFWRLLISTLKTAPKWAVTSHFHQQQAGETFFNFAPIADLIILVNFS